MCTYEKLKIALSACHFHKGPPSGSNKCLPGGEASSPLSLPLFFHPACILNNVGWETRQEWKNDGPSKV